MNYYGPLKADGWKLIANQNNCTQTVNSDEGSCMQGWCTLWFLEIYPGQINNIDDKARHSYYVTWGYCGITKII